MGKCGLLLILVASLMALEIPSSGALQVLQSGLAGKTLSLDGEEIKIIRDRFGVPHIFAATERGAYYGGGYAVAQDRLYQMERFRRDARGELAEIEGKQAFNRDAITRSFSYPEPQLALALDSLGAQVKQSFQAYADGVNTYIKEAVANKSLPERFAAVGIAEPAPWKVTDSVAIAINMARRFGSGGGGEPLNARILKKLKEKFGQDGEKIFDDLYWTNDPLSPVSVPDDSRPAEPKRRASSALRLEQCDERALASAYEVASQQSVMEYALHHDLPVKWGSYCWALAPERTVGGNAILLGAPQYGFSTPQLGHEIHYSAGPLNVIGMAIAGVPVILVGHNDSIAWTMTSGLTDMVDIFAEKLNVNNKHQYLYKGSYRDMELRVDQVKIKGERPLPIHIYRTVHGPLVAWDEQAHLAYTYAAAYEGQEIKTLEAFYWFNRARNMSEMARAAELIQTSHNIVAASASGDIGYWHCGKPPERASGYDQRLPASGTGECDWKGRVPFSKMPQVINPKQGYVISWNNKPARWWNNGDFPSWGEIFHVHRVEQLIKARSRFNFEQVRDMAIDIARNEQAADYLKPRLLAAIAKSRKTREDKRLAEAAAQLEAWDNTSSEGSVGMTIFQEWYRQILSAVFDEPLKEVKTTIMSSGYGHIYPALLQPSLLLHAIGDRKSGMSTAYDFFGGRNKDDVIVGALIKALDGLAEKRGAQMNLWGYAEETAGFGSLPGLPGVGRGTYMEIVELSRPLIRGFSILAPGQSEDPQSPHFKDQREMAGYWRYKPMLYKREQVEPASGSK